MGFCNFLILECEMWRSLDDAKNCQWAAWSSRALDRTCETETKKTLQRVSVWYQPNTLWRLS